MTVRPWLHRLVALAAFLLVAGTASVGGLEHGFVVDMRVSPSIAMRVE